MPKVVDRSKYKVTRLPKTPAWDTLKQIGYPRRITTRGWGHVHDESQPSGAGSGVVDTGIFELWLDWAAEQVRRQTGTTARGFWEHGEPCAARPERAKRSNVTGRVKTNQ